MNLKTAEFADYGKSSGSFILQSARAWCRTSRLILVVGSALAVLAFIGVQKSKASIKWTVNATSWFGASVSGFFTLGSANQILDWNIVVGPDTNTPGLLLTGGIGVFRSRLRRRV